MIELDNLTVAYDRHPAVHHISGAFGPGSLTALVGPNGAGKSTLLRAITGVLPTAQGQVRLKGINRKDIAYLPQAAAVDRSFPMTIGDLVLLGRWRRVPFWRGFTAADREAAATALAAVGLDGFAGRLLESLSAGQFQRALFARVLLQDAPVILLDEPFNAIDAKTTADLVALVRRWHAERRTVVLVSHDLDLVRINCPDTLLLARELIAWGGTETVLTAANQLRARQLAEAWDPHAHDCEAA